MRRLRTVVVWLVVIFLIYAVVTSPDRAADILEAAWDVITTAFGRLVDLVGGLFG
ncbi:hypothetical protein [Puerhibacterium puerhi]|uniref:hypothetical protein n=1 Tax=Puerhibacterium puerhi TaxID=2692623 RepID=UPI001915AACC|nr:hypothetical protein [Puerhibacterium puerhi]